MKNLVFLTSSILALSLVACTDKHGEHSHGAHDHSDHAKDSSHTKAHKDHSGHSHDHSQGNPGAHVHGEAILNIALESAEHVSIELHIPGESVVGFEYLAKSDEDKKTVATKEEQIKKSFVSSLGLPSDANCEAHGAPNVSIQHEDEKHSEWVVSVETHCHNGLAQKALNLALESLFPGLKKLRVQLIGDDLQKSIIIEGAKGTVEIN